MAAIQLGNFTGQPGGIFPMDTGTLDAMQNNLLALMTLGSIGGTNVIISGCEANSAGNSRDAGWLFLTTDSYPFGELIYFVGGSISDGLYISEETVQVAAEGVNYNAYKIRAAKPGDGTEHFEWEDIKSIKTNVQLEAMLTAAIDAAVPIGTIRMFAGSIDKVPAGWLPCDGASYEIALYPKLYQIIGSAYTTNTIDGKFTVPDLRKHFTLHANGINTIGKVDGDNGITIEARHLPPHAHSVKDYYHADTNNEGQQNYDDVGVNLTGAEASSNNNDVLFYFTHNSNDTIYESEESEIPLNHDNIIPMPPRVFINYIIRAK